MIERHFWRIVSLVFAITALWLGAGWCRAQAQGSANQSAGACTVNGKTYKNCPPALVKQARRQAARQGAIQKKGVAVKFAGVSAATATSSPLAPTAALGAGTTAATLAPGTTPDYFGVANFANSPLPVVCTGTAPPDPAACAGLPAGTLVGGLRKFMDTLPGLCGVATNNLGQCIPLATADTTTFPGSDFYKIGLSEYSLKMHTDLPNPTHLRGYVDLTNPNHQYLGPLILATRNRPVRILFNNQIATNLNIPTDTTYMGAGAVNDGTRSAMASQKRATLHLHGGNTPWISDGTTHQWITPSGGDGQASALGFSKGYSFQDVPDMVSPACVGTQCVNPTPTLFDGLQTFY